MTIAELFRPHATDYIFGLFCLTVLMFAVSTHTDRQPRQSEWAVVYRVTAVVCAGLTAASLFLHAMKDF